MKPPEPTTFFIDRALGAHKLAAILRAAGVTVEVHDEHFEQTTKDVDWIKAIGELDWVLLTKDGAMSRNVLEKQALVDARLHAFMLSNAQLNADDMGRAFLSAMPRIQKVMARYSATTVSTVTRDGGLNLRCADGEWLAKPRSMK